MRYYFRVSIAVLDYGIGNCLAVKNMLSHCGVSARVLKVPPRDVTGIVGFIIPGVGSFDAGVLALKRTGWFSFLQDVSSSTQILGICLGMQLLGHGSEEGDLEGLSLLGGFSKRLDSTITKVPHVGWNKVRVTSEFMHTPWRIINESEFYFSHSYAFNVDSRSNTVGITSHGVDFCSAAQSRKITGVQFHPEKSHKHGVALIKMLFAQESNL